MLRIRTAVPSDIPRINQIERLSGQRFRSIGMPEIADDVPTSPELLEQRAQSGQLILAEKDGSGVAFAMFHFLDNSLYIEQIDVIPEFQGQRIGAALIEYMEHQAGAKGCTAVLLSSFREVPWNAPYYRRLGFMVIVDTDLSPALQNVRAVHIAAGLDESRRCFMSKPLR